MKEVVVYDPPMCCSTGVCGPAPDPKLIQVASCLKLLEKKGVTIKRYNLSQQVGAFAQQSDVRKLLAEKGTSILPIIIVDGKIRAVGDYPTKEDFETWLLETEE
jgi:hypothetical protein